ncbi:MAG: acyltransferase family protein, partial [Acidimicrobiales bacterium]
MRPAPPDTDASGRRSSLGYIPGLDGVRAFAVAGVLAFHGGVPFLGAGFLGVDTFFVLSGFLITTLLVSEWGERATIALGSFWARRARRLLPALFLVLVFVVLYARVAVPAGTYPDLRFDALSTLLYVANWHFIATGANYFAQTAQPSLLTHTWTLAIEEQFYLLWPLLVFGVVRLTRSLRALLVVCAAGAAASVLEMALLYRPSGNLTRLYYGTDTHAQALLIGATLAVALELLGRRAGGPFTVTSTGGRRLLGALGLAGVAGSALVWSRASFASAFLWRGGFLVAAVATAAVLACVSAAPGSAVATVLSWAPLRFVGRISYGLYLWHYPLFQWIDGQRTGLTGYPLFGIRCAATLAVATASFFLVERPIRRGTWWRGWRAWA